MKKHTIKSSLPLLVLFIVVFAMFFFIVHHIPAGFNAFPLPEICQAREFPDNP